MRSIKYIAIIFIASCFISCAKEIKVPQAATSFSDVFEIFWNKMNTNYVYWDIDTTDWDAVYKQYKPLFSELDLHNNNDVKRSVRYFREMTKGLTDAHFNINFSNIAIKDSIVYPALDRKKAAAEFHNPYSYFPVVSRYLDAGYIPGYDTSAGLFALSGTIDEHVLYFTCNEFALSRSWNLSNNTGVRSALQFIFDNLDSRKGLIIDVRGNRGGDVADLNFLLGRLIDKPLQFGYTRYKNGNGRLDYTPWVPATIQPSGKAFNLPVIVLIDNFSASLAETVAMAVHALPNGIVVGETSWGATGPLISNEVYNSGQFSIPGFLSVQTSSAMFRYIDNKIYEGKGFTPDEAVGFDINALNAGRDAALETAMGLIK